MTIILFLIDTSSSMNQRTYIGTSLIDVAKAAVETFMKIRSRDPVCRWDRYMLLTFEEPPANVKAGWKESHATFMNELKNLKADGLTVLGASLKHAFDLLNMNRMQSGIDTYGQGRCPFYLEPAVIVLITDRGRLTSPNNVQLELNLPMNSVVPGCELTKEPFRWDQRIFGLVLEIPATPPVDNGFVYIPVAETHPINAMCDVTGGRSYTILSQKMLNAALESLVQKVQAGVVINFEKIGPDPKPVNEENGEMMNQYGENDKRDMESQCSGGNPAWHSNRKLIYVQRSAQKGYSVGHWPIPEAYWPDSSIQTLTPRTAQPVVQFSCTACDPLVIDNLPFDKYELEPSPLTQYILERKQPNNCWQVFVSNSAKFEFCHPFGYVKASSNLSCVNLFVMPYNYPVLLPLLDELFKVHKSKPDKNWRQQFDNYLKTMPVYYAGPLRKALQRMGAPSLIPDNMENCLNYSVITYLKKLKNQAKIEMDRLIASVGQKLPPLDGLKVNLRTKASIVQRKDFNQLLQTVGGNMNNLRQELLDYNTFTVAVQDPEIKPQYYRNPFDIPRKNLLDQISRMRTNFLQVSPSNSKLIDEDYVHSIPVQQMGNYQEYLKKMPATLREIETQPVRLHMFGNPFKVNKNIMIDEADEAVFGPQSRSKKPSQDAPLNSLPRKRKPGPLPRDLPIKRPASPSILSEASVSPPPSPKIENNITVENSSEDTALPNPWVNLQEEIQIETNHVDELSISPYQLDQSSQIESLKTDMEVHCTEFTNLNNNPNHKLESVHWNHNAKLRIILYKELRKPGKNYDKFFQYLNSMKGTLNMKVKFIKDLVVEASRFKKRRLIEHLEKFELSMTECESKCNRKFQLPTNEVHSLC
ncbi:integrator complex subunit 6-like [Argonauta hians]